MEVKKPETPDLKKLQRLRYLRWSKRISAPQVVEMSSIKFNPSYVYHVEAGRYVSRGLYVEKAIAKAVGIPWEKI